MIAKTNENDMKMKVKQLALSVEMSGFSTGLSLGACFAIAVERDMDLHWVTRFPALFMSVALIFGMIASSNARSITRRKVALLTGQGNGEAEPTDARENVS